jgi:nitrile hydratase accessory protein
VTVLDVDGPAAPPRSNGELVFAEPWESRAFGMAVTLADAGAFTWDAFRDRLVARIRAWEDEHGLDDPGFRYYACWLDALEDVLVDRGSLAGSDVAARSTELDARPAGHDHRDDEHGHGHAHSHGHGH